MNTLTTIICALPVAFQFIEMVTEKNKNLKMEKFTNNLKYSIMYQKFFLLAMGAFGLTGVVMTARFGMEKAATPRMVICCIIAVLFVKYMEMKKWNIFLGKEEMEITTIFGKKVVPYSEIEKVKCTSSKKVVYVGGKKIVTVPDTALGFDGFMKVLKRKKVKVEY